MSGRTIGAVTLGLPFALILGLLLFVGIAEEEEALACARSSVGSPALDVDPSSVPDGPIAGYSGEQLVIAATIMVVAREERLSAWEQQVGVMTAMGESSLTNLDHGDAARADTIGVFQIGAEHGSKAERMDPVWSAENFFQRLQAVEGYRSLKPTIAAHRAQRNADPYHYERFWNPAGEVLSALAGVETSEAVPVAAAPGGYDLGPVTPELHALVNVLGPMFGIETVGGYRASATDANGHPAGRAADFMVPLTAEGRAQGDALVAYAQAHAAELKIDYILWYQRIWSADRAAEGWRPMEDRGSATANHRDHPHINVLAGTSGPVDVSNVATNAACRVTLVSSGAWMAPLDAPITSEYGARVHPVSGLLSFHDGVDYGAECGTEFRAASSGVVVKAGPDEIYGHQIVIDHGGGVETKYGHMSADGVLVEVGEQVGTGDVIGKVGDEGLSTGCHLHFTVTVDGEHTDPVAFLASPPSSGGLDGGVTVVQANIKQNAADVATVSQLQPDLIALNETSALSNGQLGAAGYDAFRPEGGNIQQRSTAVAWRTDRWQLVDGGRVQLVDDGPQQWDAGRSATWSTVQDDNGAQVTIVSVHHMVNPRYHGPDRPRRRELYAEGMRRLQNLVLQLSPAGPVFVAGDFNSRYSDNDPWGPRAMLGLVGMKATFEQHGVLVTHDDGGTIDYVLSDVAVTGPAAQQRVNDLNSDHKALIAVFAGP